MSSLPPAIRIVEVGPRDGLQNIDQHIPTNAKIQFINILSDAKLSEIEVTSFVSPKWIPQLADAQEVSNKIIRDPHIIYTALVPNVYGLDMALDADYSSVAVFTAASETFSLKNTNCSITDSIKRIEDMKSSFQESSLRVRAYISTVWACPYEGNIPAETVLPIINSLFELGVEEISLGDTIGKATSEDVKKTLKIILSEYNANRFSLHFHDTYNHALENIKVGMEYGITSFDSSAGGIGGCPFAPGASGNISTDSIIKLCQKLGIKTGIKEKKISEASKLIQTYLN